jgi:pimeloyl-ACP methyl ester carboxylesterase
MSLTSAPAGASPAPDSGTVVLLHGLAANSWWMTLLATRLRQQGYRALNWGYPSVRCSLQELIPKLAERFQRLQEKLPADRPLHIVGHSMGSILSRGILSQIELPALRRLVMLSPPNAGSHVATRIGARLRWLTPLFEELADHDASLVNRLPRAFTSEVQVGVIAAAWDYVVRESSTHLEGETDHIVLPSRHSGLVLRRPAAEQIVHFLKHGRFHREPCACCVPQALEIAGGRV